MMEEHVLIAYGFDGKGSGESLYGERVAELIEDEQLSWVHLDANHDMARDWLENNVPTLDPYIVKALMVEDTRPRLSRVGKGVLLILRGVNLNQNADPEDMISIRLWAEEHRIISVRRRPLKAISDLEMKIKNGKGPRNTGDFICMLSSHLFERMEPVLSELDEMLDDIEEKLLESTDTSLREDIIDVRRKAIIFRRYMAPQRDAIIQLQVSDLPWINEMHRRHLQEDYNHVTRCVEDLDVTRERAQIIKDELANVIADKLNRNMYFLSVISAIFLPLGFLTGLLGINVGGIPGANDGEAFWIFCAILSVIVLLQVLIFKKLKWF